jgi:hypothetical protein
MRQTLCNIYYHITLIYFRIHDVTCTLVKKEGNLLNMESLASTACDELRRLVERLLSQEVWAVAVISHHQDVVLEQTTELAHKYHSKTLVKNISLNGSTRNWTRIPVYWS